MTSPIQALKFLVVDDNKINQLVIGNKLKSLNQTVIFADNGKEAVAKFAQEEFDVVLMDLMMPVMDGFEATLRIKETAKGQKTPIIAVTADTLESDRKKCYEVGMTGYLNKPFELNKLQRLLVDLGYNIG
jgi:CheY-like chemotaxis protein